MVVLVEEVSSSLVREYLSRKGLKRTIACMDEEHPRTVASINNRSQLREILNIEDLYKKNKIHNSPFKTLLEIIVNHHIEQLKNYRISRSEVGFLQSTLLSSADSPAETPSEMNDIQSDEYTSPLVYSKRTKNRPEIQGGCPSRPTYMSLLSEEDGLASYDQANSLAYNSNCQKGQPLKTSEEDIVGFGQRKPDKNTSVIATIQRSRNNRIRRGMVTGPMPQESNKKRQIRRAEVSQPLFRKEEENNYSQEGILSTGIHKKIVESSRTVNSLPDCGGGRQELLSPSGSQNKDGKMEQNILKTRNIKTKPNLSDMIVSELVLDDIDDDDDDDDDVRESSKVSIQKTVAECLYTGRPMDQHIAMGLKAVLLGSSQNYLNAEWRNQGFTFSEIHDLSYGIVQRKGGPCGVLASIQAFVLKKLLFENTESSNTGLQRLRPSNATRRQCLILALAEILWRAGEEKQATVAINSGKSHFTPSGHFRSEGVLEKIMYFTVNNFKDLQFILEQHIEQFESGMLGCILLTISAILSRSIEKVREDMDVPSTTLIAAHGYCTQELVNLLLCGRAASNVFDNDMELDSGNGNMMLLKGIKGHCDVGLLSLFEHYNICKVGAYLKTPSYPIWVVCSESHFSVLFGLQRELLTNEDKGLGFDLYYYDGLANQQEEIRLTISIGNLSQSFQNVDTDLIPPLELCIRTRWKDAFVSWNDTEPLL